MSRPSTYRFRLYVAGEGLNATRAISNLSQLCKTHFAERCEIEVVDVFKEPSRALADKIFITPTLLKLSPAPIRSIVGTLSHTQQVLEFMGLDAVAA
jgi:circadian clock protein KaiB